MVPHRFFSCGAALCCTTTVLAVTVNGVDELIDAGTGIAGLVDDFDKERRPQGIGIDIGADEYTVDASGQKNNISVWLHLLLE